MSENEGTSAVTPETDETRLKNAKMSRRTAKAALTRAGKALNHLIEAKRPQEEVSESFLLYKKTFETLVSKREEYASLMESDELFTVEERWFEDCQETFMNLDIEAKFYTESIVGSISKPPNTNTEAGTSNSSLEQQIDGETSVQRSDGIPTISIMPENDDSGSITRTSGSTNESPAAQAPSSVITVDDSDPAEHANRQSPSQTCSF